MTRDLGPKEQGVDATEAMGWKDEDGAPGQWEQRLLLDGAAPESGATDEDAVQEIAFEETASSDRGVAVGDGIPVFHGGTGRAYRSFEEMIEDPAFPMGPASEPWA